MLRHNPMSATSTSRLRESERAYALTRAAARLRADGLCEIHGGHRGTEAQHRVRRGMGGSAHNPGVHAVSSLLWVCHTAGRLADLDPDRYVNGWSVHRGQDTTAVPVLLADGWFLLDDEGGRTAAPDQGSAA